MPPSFSPFTTSPTMANKKPLTAFHFCTASRNSLHVSELSIGWVVAAPGFGLLLSSPPSSSFSFSSSSSSSPLRTSLLLRPIRRLPLLVVFLVFASLPSLPLRPRESPAPSHLPCLPAATATAARSDARRLAVSVRYWAAALVAGAQSHPCPVRLRKWPCLLVAGLEPWL